MDYVPMTVFGIAFIFLMTALGSALVFCFKKKISPQLNAAFLGLASGIMLAASVWSLLLPAIEQAAPRFGNGTPWLAGLAFLFGGGSLILLDKLFPARGLTGNTGEGDSRRIRRLFLAVSLHNIPEGLAVGFAFGVAHALGTPAAYAAALSLAIGVGVQNLPEGAAVSLPLSSVYGNKKKAFFLGVLSGIPEPIFAVLGFFLAAQIRSLQPWLLAFSAGAMVFVVVADLIPETKSDKEEKIPIGACCAMLGFVLMMALDIVLG